MATTQAVTTTTKCPNCGAVNRIDPDKIARGEVPVCGRCSTPLPVDQTRSVPSGGDGKPITVTDATFAEQVEKSLVPVLVDLWAPWCGPCRAIAPALDQLASELAGKANIAKLNVDENPRTSARFQVTSIPLLLIFKEGKEVDRLVGAQPKAVIAKRLERFL
jgi:thioredoxin